MSDDRAEPKDQRDPKPRARIPRSEWPTIVERHRRDEPLADIARSYGTTPAAISNIIRQAEATGSPDTVQAQESAPAATDTPPPAPVPERPRQTLRSPAAAPRPVESAPVAEREKEAPSVEDRVRQGSEQLLAAYAQWRERREGSTASELQQTLHELRKALARIEIDIAAGRPSDLSPSEGHGRRPRGRH